MALITTEDDGGTRDVERRENGAVRDFDRRTLSDDTEEPTGQLTALDTFSEAEVKDPISGRTQTTEGTLFDPATGEEFETVGEATDVELPDLSGIAPDFSPGDFTPGPEDIPIWVWAIAVIALLWVLRPYVELAN